MKKKNISLKKKIIASLSDIEKDSIKGGAYTTSFSNCTHFICCGDTCSPTGSVLDTSCLPNSYNPSTCNPPQTVKPNPNC